MGVARVAAQEHPVVERVLLRDALADGVHRVPLDALPLDEVRPEDLLGRRLHLLHSGRLAGAPVRVRRGGELDVEPDHAVLTRYDHDRPVFGVYRAFHLGGFVNTGNKSSPVFGTYPDHFEGRRGGSAGGGGGNQP